MLPKNIIHPLTTARKIPCSSILFKILVTDVCERRERKRSDRELPFTTSQSNRQVFWYIHCCVVPAYTIFLLTPFKTFTINDRSFILLLTLRIILRKKRWIVAKQKKNRWQIASLRSFHKQQREMLHIFFVSNNGP